MPIDINYDLRGDPTVGEHTAVPGYNVCAQIEGAIMQYVQVADACQGYDFMWATVRSVQSPLRKPMLPLISDSCLTGRALTTDHPVSRADTSRSSSKTPICIHAARIGQRILFCRPRQRMISTSTTKRRGCSRKEMTSFKIM